MIVFFNDSISVSVFISKRDLIVARFQFFLSSNKNLPRTPSVSHIWAIYAYIIRWLLLLDENQCCFFSPFLFVVLSLGMALVFYGFAFFISVILCVSIGVAMCMHLTMQRSDVIIFYILLMFHYELVKCIFQRQG